MVVEVEDVVVRVSIPRVAKKKKKKKRGLDTWAGMGRVKDSKTRWIRGDTDHDLRVSPCRNYKPRKRMACLVNLWAISSGGARDYSWLPRKCRVHSQVTHPLVEHNVQNGITI
jgi:hypothetical protein